MYTFTEREKLYTLFEELTGARFTTSYTRIGGVARDLPDGWLAKVEKFVDELPKAIDEVEKLLTRNRIFLDRTEDIGVITKDDAIAYGNYWKPICVPVGWILTSEKTNRTAVMKSMNLMSPSEPKAIATTATLSVLRRSGRVY